MRQETMTSRQRVIEALNHRETDRVPIDLGGTWSSTTTVAFYNRLKAHFNIDTPATLVDPMMQVCMIDEQILKKLHVDTRCVFYNSPELERNRSIKIKENQYRDRWGIEWINPSSSYYYDLHKSPLSGKITFSDIMNHSWPEPHDPGYTRGLRERVEKMRSETDCAMVLNFDGWVLQLTQNLRGYEDWYLDIALDPGLIECMADCVTKSLLGPIEMVTDAIGDMVDVIALDDDIGHQEKLCISPASYRKIFKPFHAHLIEAVKSRSNKPILWHTCGSVYDILDDLIEIGVDAINPVQTTAKNMEAARLKEDFGDRLSFWGGIDTMRILNSGTVEDVQREVKNKIETLAPGGGFILTPIHNIQPDVPVENVLAMIDASLEYGWFPLERHNEV